MLGNSSCLGYRKRLFCELKLVYVRKWTRVYILWGFIFHHYKFEAERSRLFIRVMHRNSSVRREERVTPVIYSPSLPCHYAHTGEKGVWPCRRGEAYSRLIFMVQLGRSRKVERPTLNSVGMGLITLEHWPWEKTEEITVSAFKQCSRVVCPCPSCRPHSRCETLLLVPLPQGDIFERPSLVGNWEECWQFRRGFCIDKCLFCCLSPPGFELSLFKLQRGQFVSTRGHRLIPNTTDLFV